VVTKLHRVALDADVVEIACDSSRHLGMCGVEVGAQLTRCVRMPGNLFEVDADVVQFVYRPCPQSAGQEGDMRLRWPTTGCRLPIRSPCSATGLRPRLPESGIVGLRSAGAHHFMDVAWKRDFDSGQHVGPRLFASGYFLTTTGGHFLTLGHGLLTQIERVLRMVAATQAENGP
jgi:hypothetical protein